MKIAFTASGDTLDAPFDNRFGRSANFIIYDTESKEVKSISNEKNLNAMQGAGVQSAQTISRSGAEILVTGHCGPKAFRVLSQSGIKIFTANAQTVSQALESYLAGTLSSLESSDVEGHWI